MILLTIDITALSETRSTCKLAFRIRKWIRWDEMFDSIEIQRPEETLNVQSIAEGILLVLFYGKLQIG
jgi:hypothetical protein